MSDLEKFEGEVENIIYSNEETGYCIFSVVNLADGDEVVCTASIGKINLGETVMLSGNYIDHPSHGPQFKVTNFEKNIPKTTEGMQKYLASGTIKGIGEKMAFKIIAEFGLETFEVIENHHEKLSEISGITLKKAQQISEQFHEQAGKRAALVFLQSYGITPGLANRIVELYKDKTIDIVRNNPYKMAEDIAGIGFKTADTIAHRLGIEFESKFRIKSGVVYCLSNATLNGHTFLPKEDLISNATDVLEVPKELVETALIELQVEKAIIQENLIEYTAVFLNSFYYAENYIAKRLLDLSSNIDEKSETIDEDISLVEERLDIKLAEKQKQAVSEAMAGGVLVVTGGPGTGKTTTLNALIYLLKKEGYNIELAAPTGKASKRMSEATGEPAKTIHRLLEYKPLANGAQSFEKNEGNPIEADVIIVDESSMVDIMLMYSLLKATESGTRLILVGDADQLPSVGPGNVLKDIIASNVIRTICLDEIFRQATTSHIVVNAHKINKGEYPNLNDKNSDFFLVKRNSMWEVENTILDLVTNRIPKFKNYKNIQDIQVLTPMKRSNIGVFNLNKSLQKVLNPPSSDKKEFEYRDTIFRVGDKVMQNKNNYKIKWAIFNEKNEKAEEGEGVFNGDEGVITGVDLNMKALLVVFDDNKSVLYSFDRLDELNLGYAVTIHKSQGSEYKTVILPVFNGPKVLLSRNLLYTAITRAKELVILVGLEGTIREMVDNNREINRFSSLDKKIIKFSALLR